MFALSVVHVQTFRQICIICRVHIFLFIGILPAVQHVQNMCYELIFKVNLLNDIKKDNSAYFHNNSHEKFHPQE